MNIPGASKYVIFPDEKKVGRLDTLLQEEEGNATNRSLLSNRQEPNRLGTQERLDSLPSETGR